MKNIHERSGRPDALQALTDARPDELDPCRLANAPRQREDLALILAGATDLPAARSRVRGPLWGGIRPLGAVVALTAVAASTVVVTTLDWNPSGGHADAAPPSSSAAAKPGADGAVRMDGRLELLSVAKKAEAPVAEGTYWQTTTHSQDVNVVSAKGDEEQLFAVRTTSSAEWSVGVRPGTRSLMVSGLDGVTEPRTKADEARWLAAGSPTTVEAAAKKADNLATLGYTMGTRPPMVMRTDADDKIYALGPQNITYQDVRELPADTGELRRLLEKLYARDSGAEAGDGRNAYVLRQAANLITMPVKPAVRAAAYRVMAELPGVRALGRVTDPLGREGVGFTFPGTASTPLGRVEQRLVVDPSTGEMLAEQSVLAEPSARAEEAGLDAGTTVNYSATIRMGWGEDQITVPKNARR
ncbi:CU044_5270 family protein [Streptomyces sp. NPDC060205]|uniref:CU044_5270 family protein n=1 Tax=Streptomyces sp. NPDC060205 TaxID=3347072 RepID=UPI003660F5E9